MEVVLTNNSASYQRIQRRYFYGQECTGEPYDSDYVYYNACDGAGISLQCGERGSIPELVKMDGLVT
jgi:hypothetical protein